jgi:hypothetical protein
MTRFLFFVMLERYRGAARTPLAVRINRSTGLSELVSTESQFKLAKASY